jgi:mono/diheme cytochrome c family protein
MHLTRLAPLAALLTIAVSLALPQQARSSAAPAAAPPATLAAQESAGGKLFAAQCSACHGANLRGVAGPALIGDAFTAQFTDEPASDTYALMSKWMPVTAPGTLTPTQYVALMAYILDKNHLVSGTAPLTRASLHHIIIVSPAH